MTVKEEHNRTFGGSMVQAPIIYAQSTTNKRAETRSTRRGKSQHVSNAGTF